MPKNIVKIKADAFAIRIVNAYRYLTEEKKKKECQTNCTEVEQQYKL